MLLWTKHILAMLERYDQSDVTGLLEIDIKQKYKMENWLVIFTGDIVRTRLKAKSPDVYSGLPNFIDVIKTCN
jgi:hypothetical protein